MYPREKGEIDALFGKALSEGTATEHLSVKNRLLRFSMTPHKNWDGDDEPEMLLVIEDLGDEARSD